MPHYLIHVGPHKTGTTFLQLRFHAARDRLRACGVLFPTGWCSAEGEPSHRKLVVGLREGQATLLQSQFEAIEQAEPDVVLISAEGINHLARPALCLLRALIAPHPVTIIFYCRRWSELLPSLWQERVKHGYDETFPAFFSDNISDPFESPVMNFARRLDLYADVFGRENLTLRSYSDLDDSGVDLAADFFEVFLPQQRCVADAVSALQPSRPNQSLPALTVEIIRALNGFHIRNGVQPPDATLRNWYMAGESRLDLGNLLSTMQGDAATLRFSDASAGARHLHDRLWRDYGDLMVRPGRYQALFAPREAAIGFFSQRYLTCRSAWLTLESVYTRFRQETASQHPG